MRIQGDDDVFVDFKKKLLRIIYLASTLITGNGNTLQLLNVFCVIVIVDVL